MAEGQALQKLREELNASNIHFTENEALSRHTTFCIGGPAAIFCTPANRQQLASVLGAVQRNGVPFYLLGKGSNVLFCDEGYNGVVIHLGDGFCSYEIAGDTMVAGAGCKLADACKAAAQAGLSGLEFAYGIPGGVGGAVYMNAGAYGGEMRQVVESVTYLGMDGMEHTLSNAGLQFGYRSSVFQSIPGCILSARFALQAGSTDEILAQMEDYMERRRQKQPLDMPSAGSAFKRPPGAFAGALIDQCGLRGFQMGGAAISQKHCGFIVNMGGATCRDVLALADTVAEKVLKETGHILEKEIRVVTV